MKLGASGSGEVRDRKVEPALTAEEWAGIIADDWTLDSRLAYTLEEADLGHLEYRAGSAPPRQIAAALCLYGQPFGFTWNDVELLLGIVESMAVHMPDTAARAISLADRIAALLPPREET